MRAGHRGTLMALTLVLLAAPELAAQHRRPGLRHAGPDGRSGFWGVLTVGAGVEQVNFENDGLGYSDELTNPAGSLRLGGTPSPHWRLGGEVSSWINEVGPLTETVGGVQFIAQFYPARRAGFFIKAGAGMGYSTVDDDFGGSTTDYGFGGSFGLGYDVRLARHLYLVPSVDFASYEFDSGDGDNYRERIATFGLGIAYQR